MCENNQEERMKAKANRHEGFLQKKKDNRDT